MKKNILTGILFLTSILLVLTFNGCDKEGVLPPDPPPPFVRLLENQTVESTMLNRDMRYAVILPEDYPTSGENYPVVYLLHGFGEDETGWYKGGQVQFYIDQNAAVTVPMIYVMPQGFNTYYVNKYNGHYPYMDYVVNELVPAIDSLFRTIPDAQHRAVMGYSMGGYGAMILPAKNPDVFKTSVVLSMSFRTDEQYLAEPQSVFDYQWGPIFGGTGTSGEARLTDYFKQYSPFHFLGTPGSTAFDGINLFIDCGDDEETLSVTSDAFHDTLRSLGIPHEYRVRNGAHTWSYWHGALPEALAYIGKAVQQIPYPAEPEPADPGNPVAATRILHFSLPENDFAYNVFLPEGYENSGLGYPAIIFLHERTQGREEQESQDMYAMLNKNMVSGKLPQSLVLEIPFQENFDSVNIKNVVEMVKTDFRVSEDKNQIVLAGNGLAGGLALEMAPQLAQTINACLLYDAAVVANATAETPDISFYLDISSNGLNYKGYHSLYTSLRNNEIPHEYRVRQGLPGHQSLLSGIEASSGFLGDHLRN